MSLLIFFNLLNCVQTNQGYLSLLDSLLGKDIASDFKRWLSKLMQFISTAFTGINFFAKILFGILQSQMIRLRGTAPDFDRCIILDTAYELVNKNTVAC